jgi:hypothetical protein
MTVSRCVRFCTGAEDDSYGNRIAQGDGLPFAALQNGNMCFCGGSFGRYGPVSDDLCQVPCIGNVSAGFETCGGRLYNAVYKTYIPSSSTGAGDNGACPTVRKTSVNSGESSPGRAAEVDNTANSAIIGVLASALFLLGVGACFMQYSRYTRPAFLIKGIRKRRMETIRAVA